MRAPTPVTIRSIERLNASTVRPSGTAKSGARLIQEIEGALAVCCEKIRHAQTKLPSTAATEMNALSVRNARVAVTMMNAASNGKRSASQGTEEVITLKLQRVDVLDVRGAAEPVERND